MFLFLFSRFCLNLNRIVTYNADYTAESYSDISTWEADCGDRKWGIFYFAPIENEVDFHDCHYFCAIIFLCIDFMWTFTVKYTRNICISWLDYLNVNQGVWDDQRRIRLKFHGVHICDFYTFGLKQKQMILFLCRFSFFFFGGIALWFIRVWNKKLSCLSNLISEIAWWRGQYEKVMFSLNIQNIFSLFFIVFLNQP